MLTTSFGCGGSVRTVPMIHEPGGFAEVGFPPPPAKVELLPEDPGSPCAWQDGFWEWRSSAWAWIPGKWVWHVDGCFFSPPAAVWTTGMGAGTLRYRPGRWVSQNGSPCPDPAPCRARPVDESSTE
jgi:hypothetical protein